MTTYQLNKTVGVVEVPSVLLTFRIHIDYLVMGISEHDVISKCRKISRGDTQGFLKIGKDWQFLSLSKDMTEELAQQLVSKFDNSIGGYSGLDGFGHFNTALESLRSWERANGYVTVNPYGVNEPLREGAFILPSEWEQWNLAQQQVVNIAYLIKG